MPKTLANSAVHRKQKDLRPVSTLVSYGVDNDLLYVCTTSLAL